MAQPFDCLCGSTVRLVATLGPSRVSQAEHSIEVLGASRRRRQPFGSRVVQSRVYQPVDLGSIRGEDAKDEKNGRPSV